MVTVPWGSIATFFYSRIWNFSTVLAKKRFLGGNFLNLHTVVVGPFRIEKVSGEYTLLKKNAAWKVAFLFGKSEDR